ncbi:MAG TPA: uracil-DNA glycosylase [Planctomycetota bacterium]|nr:uracil-DNA glycosylase [Planctomycetota bacterium]
MPAEPTAPRSDLRAAVRALLADADAFGVLGDGANRRPAADVARASTPARGFGPAPTAPTAPVPPPHAAAAAATPATSPVADPATALAGLACEIDACRRCALGGQRTRSVPGQGSPRAELVFVGEAPGADEDREGLAFVGAAGALLTKMIGAMGLSRDEVFIANVLKCRPPGNREPAPDEVAQCRGYLERQLAAIRPKVICALGAHAARSLLQTEQSVGKLRGRAHPAFGAQVVATYHPAYLLRTPSEKPKAWEDLKLVLKLLGREPPARAPAAAPEPVA